MSDINGETLNVVSLSRIRTQTDGEGVTTLVVSMGCPLRCAYCINPFTWDGSFKGKIYTAEDLYNELKIDNLYFLATGGGVMFGGGEPLLNADFISSFITKYKSTGWKFSMETSINVPLENLKKVIGLIDLFIVDTKDMNKERYELYTKADYDNFYNNLKYLLKEVGPERIIARVPVIPELHKDKEYEDNVKALQEIGIKGIEVFRYVNPSVRKELSDTSKKNTEEFLSKIKKDIE